MEQDEPGSKNKGPKSFTGPRPVARLEQGSEISGARSLLKKTTPSPPDYLDQVAKDKWSDLAGLRVFSSYELDQLASYCANYSRARTAEAFLADPKPDEFGNPTQGLVATILDDKQNIRTIIASPQIGIAERAAREMSRIGKALRLHRRAEED